MRFTPLPLPCGRTSRRAGVRTWVRLPSRLRPLPVVCQRPRPACQSVREADDGIWQPVSRSASEPGGPADPAEATSFPTPGPAAEMSTSGPPPPGVASGSNRRLQQAQNQVDEVVDIMRVNVDKVLERDQKLSELDDRADALQAGASQFETSAAKLKRKYWWKNCKMWAILITVAIVIIIIIIVWSVSS
ncbi:vesicle-associated membrane protein 3 [Sarcophilus harrisii]|uniref:Vesicle associated membrane protein 3 n=1 Tax=Sarcophilus harrisii TaxID=9305 RepID=A0A7N4V827_SARHA|nr:vesicle-associated membrane protein 3 [Sarcophilus harrisii]